jgi:hypothetical protein
MKITTRRAGIILLDSHSLWYACNRCGQQWSPNLVSGGRGPRGWWRCPKGCNAAT